MSFDLFATQEPPIPEPSETPQFAPTQLLYIAIVLIVAGIIAWKYKAILEFIAILCSTAAGFVIGFIATPPYGNFGLGMMIATAGLLLSAAAVAFIRIIKPKRASTTT
ncbi:MAG: hypothetical protein ACPLZY_02260 [Candidatus Norongarragalinales archaeon]